MNRKVLLIGGGGTLGSYTSEELLKMGCQVDIICLEELHSETEQLTYYQAEADEAYLESFLHERYYDGIVNFIHYTSLEAYRPVHQLLTKKTDQLIYLSSYRIYADQEHPITENAPRLLEQPEYKEFLAHEDYAVPKSQIEDYLRKESGTHNWTIVRPVISFSKRRLDLVTRSGRELLDMAKAGDVITLPKEARYLTAGLDWAGNSGKLIAHLLFKKETLGEAYTISTAQNLTWNEVADIYSELLHVKFQWIPVEEYFKENEKDQKNPYMLKCDRLFDRKIDNRKVLAATGLCKEDFASIREGIEHELAEIEKESEKKL